MQKKIPLRTCICCRQQKDKRELVRIVKFGDKISVDLTGKANGRGAYVCNDLECVKKLKKQKMLSKAFSCQVNDEVYDEITEALFGKQD